MDRFAPCASNGGHSQIVQLLIAHHADVNARTPRCLTPLNTAQGEDVVKILKQNGSASFFGDVFHRFFKSSFCNEWNPPKMESLQSGGVGVSIRIVRGFFEEKYIPLIIYFLRLDEEKNFLEQSDLFLPNYVYKDQFFLLNAKPGRYVVIGTFLDRNAVAPSMFMIPGTPVFVVIGPGSQKRVIFSKDLIEQTEVQIGPGEFAYMGNFLINPSCEKDLDDVQLFFNQIFTRRNDPKIENACMDDKFDTHHRDPKHEKYFFEEAIKHIDDPGWKNKMSEKLETLN